MTASNCSCPDYRYRGRLRPCKHVLELRAALDVVAAANQRKWDRIDVDNRKAENRVT